MVLGGTKGHTGADEKKLFVAKVVLRDKSTPVKKEGEGKNTKKLVTGWLPRTTIVKGENGQLYAPS